ncbi:signal transduction histidine kinase [Lipomyces oligophaga]|uniref:signal transduction histidine kinase n=1 Tax=Lipomyces oligophaga TaxID=45792 RepID=UPI0034CD934A
MATADIPTIIDFSIFNQLLEMDDDETDREFSHSIVLNFFEQAETTFTKMDEALAHKDLKELSSLGHFLKGSSAALGLTLVKDTCEKIQHLGAGKDAAGDNDISDPTLALSQISPLLITVRHDYAESEKALRKFYDSQ